eukprot:3534787-Rhodomonas_salina.2
MFGGPETDLSRGDERDPHTQQQQQTVAAYGTDLEGGHERDTAADGIAGAPESEAGPHLPPPTPPL